MKRETAAVIMIVDDEPENLRVLTALLSDDGFIVRSFPDATRSLRSAKSDPPDLILLDIRMPTMDGFEFCAHLKATPSLKDIPVLFLSAADEVENKVRAFAQGGADYITKPFQAEEVLSRVDTHLAVSRYRNQLETLNRELEERVQERTADLLETNRILRQEIDARHAAEADLKESEKNFRRIVTTANEAIITADAAYTIVYANQVAHDLFNGTDSQLIGQLMVSLIHEDDRPVFEQRMKERKSGQRGIYECRIRRLDGDVRWVNVSASPIIDSSGRFTGSVALLTDITARKRSELELKQAVAEIDQLRKQIEADKAYLQEEIKLDHNYDQIIGNSDEIKYVLHRLEQVARTDSTVIILGETGTGKELIARALHATSKRAARPLIKVNCATLPEQFIESELFGHVKGAFTDAGKDRQGRFELADRGTIFLDEIGELPLALQPKLLRVLQDGEFERLGDNRTIQTDVRVIAATNRDIEALVKSGMFRNDLWYRINVFPITVPPLRDRPDDIPLLVKHFIQKKAKIVGKKVLEVPDRLLETLMAYDWPGNIRELEHVIERGIIGSRGDWLEITELLTPSAAAASGKGLKSHADMERVHILRVLERTGWVIEGPRGAARILDIPPNTLRYRMKKLHIHRPGN